MRSNWNEDLQQRLHRADPAVRLLVEAVAVSAEDVRDREEEWAALDPTLQVGIVPRGGVVLAGNGTNHVEQLSADGYVGLPGPALLVEWVAPFSANRGISSVTLRLDAQLDPAQPQVAQRWALDLYRVHALTNVSGSAQLQPLWDTVYANAAGPSGGDVVFDLGGFAQVGPPPLQEGQGTTVAQPLDPNAVDTPNLDAGTSRPVGGGSGKSLYNAPITVVAVRPLTADGAPAVNAGWAVVSGQSEAGHADYLLHARTLGAPDTTGYVALGPTAGMPYIRLSGRVYAQATVGFTANTNQINLGSTPTVDVELVGQGESSGGSSISYEVRNDAGVYVAFRDGDLVATDNTPFGGMNLIGVSRRQTYRMRATLTPDAAGLASPTLRLLGARAVTRRLFDHEARVRSRGACGFDPITQVGEIQEAQIEIARTGPRDYRDPGTELLAGYDVAGLSFRIWVGHPSVPRSRWLHLHTFLVDDVDTAESSVLFTGVTPLALLRTVLPPFDTGSSSRAAIEYANAALPLVYSDLLGGRAGIPERYRGPGIPGSVTDTVSKRIADKTDAKAELDAVAMIAGGAMISSQGRVAWVNIDSSTAPAATFPRAEIQEVNVGPGYRARRPEFFVPFAWNEEQGRFTDEVRSFHLASLESVGTIGLDAPPSLDDVAARWIDTAPLASKVADRVTRFSGLGLMLWSFTAQHPHPHLEPGDVVLVETDRFVARDPNLGQVLRGALWARARITAVHDLEGREFTVWVQQYADIIASGEPVDVGGVGPTPTILGQPTVSYDGDQATVLVFASSSAVSLWWQESVDGEWGAEAKFADAQVGRLNLQASRTGKRELRVRPKGPNDSPGEWVETAIDRYEELFPPRCSIEPTPGAEQNRVIANLRFSAVIGDGIPGAISWQIGESLGGEDIVWEAPADNGTNAFVEDREIPANRTMTRHFFLTVLDSEGRRADSDYLVMPSDPAIGEGGGMNPAEPLDGRTQTPGETSDRAYGGISATSHAISVNVPLARVAPTLLDVDSATGRIATLDSVSVSSLRQTAYTPYQNLWGAGARTTRTNLASSSILLSGTLDDFQLTPGDVISFGAEMWDSSGGGNRSILRLTIFDSLGGSTIYNTSTSTLWPSVPTMRAVEGITIPGNATSLRFQWMAFNSAGTRNMKRFVLNRGPSIRAYSDPPFRIDRETGDAVRDGATKRVTTFDEATGGGRGFGGLSDVSNAISVNAPLARMAPGLPDISASTGYISSVGTRSVSVLDTDVSSGTEGRRRVDTLRRADGVLSDSVTAYDAGNPNTPYPLWDVGRRSTGGLSSTTYAITVNAPLARMAPGLPDLDAGTGRVATVGTRSVGTLNTDVSTGISGWNRVNTITLNDGVIHYNATVNDGNLTNRNVNEAATRSYGGLTYFTHAISVNAPLARMAPHLPDINTADGYIYTVAGRLASNVGTGADRANTALDANSRLTDLRRFNMTAVGNLAALQEGLTISYAPSVQGNGYYTVTVSAHYLHVAGYTLSYSSASIDVLSQGIAATKYYLFYDDFNFAGGSMILQATPLLYQLTDAPGRYAVGSTLIPKSDGTGGGGYSPGGGALI